MDQRYNVNVKLLLWLAIGTLVGGSALGGLYYVQSRRGADKLLTMAAEQKAEGNLQQAAWTMWRYHQTRPDDMERAAEMAEMFAQVAELDDVEPQDQLQAVTIVEATVRKDRKNAKLRRRLVDLLMKVPGGVKPASNHLEIMVEKDPKNGELLTMLARCYLVMQLDEKGLRLCSEIVGFDPSSGEFDPEAAKAPKEVDVYSYLVGFLRRTKADPEKTDKVMDRLIEVMPNSADAYVARARYLVRKQGDHKDAALADIDKALELDGKHVKALMFRAQRHAEVKEFAQAKELLKRGLEVEKDNFDLYYAMARFSTAEAKDLAAGIEWYEKGIENTSGSAKVQLMVQYALSLIDNNNLEEGRKKIEELRKNSGFPKQYEQYLTGKLQAAEGKWHTATKTLEGVRTALSSSSEISQGINISLAICYTRLQAWEKVIDSTNRVLEANPQHQFAIEYRTAAKKKLGMKVDSSEQNTINDIVGRELRKPEDMQDWTKVMKRATEYCDSMLEEGKITESKKLLIMSEIHLRAKQYAEARSLIRKAIGLDKENVNTWRSACRLIASDPDGGAVKALKRLDTVVDQFGDLPLLRLDRADIYLALNDEKVVEQVMSVTEGYEKWDKKDQVMIWSNLARRFESLRAADALRTARGKIAELAPNELSNVFAMFSDAYNRNDDDRMAETQDMILKIVGSKSDSYWLYTEAQRIISQFSRGLVDEKELAKVEQLVIRAQEQRPEWHMLYLLRSHLALAKQDRADALRNLDKAAELGPPTMQSLMQHVALLMQAGRYDDARKQIDRSSKTVRERLLGRQYAETLLNSRYLGVKDKRWEESVPVAKRVGELSPNDASTQLWLGRFMLNASMSSRLADSTKSSASKYAGEAFERAVELAPKSEEAWLSYFSYLAATKQVTAARDAVRRVQLSLDEDQLPMVLAAGYDVLLRWFDAENTYRLALQEDPDNLMILRRLASFYLSGRYRLKDKVEKATPLINKILLRASDDDSLAAEPNVMWARRTAAKLLARTGQYQKALDAERLLESNVVDGALSLGDKLTLAKILATRPEPASKMRAVEYYEDTLQTQDLSPEDSLTLGQLYYATDRWNDCQRQMSEVISRNQKYVEARDSYIRMLLIHGEQRDLKAAERHLKRLQEVAPTSPQTLELLVRLSAKIGREKEVIPMLRKLLTRGDNRKNPALIVEVASLLASLEDLDNAEKLYVVAAKMTPHAKLPLAGFLGRHRDMDKALDLLEEAEEDVGKSPVLRAASGLMNSMSDEVSEAQHLRVQGWMDRALREDPESIPLLMQQAQLYETRKMQKESAAMYRQLLARKDLEGMNRAIVFNNLAYQLALSSNKQSELKEALKYIKGATKIMGPRTDILDTRAVVYMALGNVDQAVTDMELAVLDTPTASKYFHKSRAHLLARQQDKAVEAWDKALELGLNAEEIGTVERRVFEEVQSKIQKLKGVEPGQQEAA